jgi:hypothetical protein
MGMSPAFTIHVDQDSASREQDQNEKKCQSVIKELQISRTYFTIEHIPIMSLVYPYDLDIKL